mgnify:CR=1 FL=1
MLDTVSLTGAQWALVLGLYIAAVLWKFSARRNDPLLGWALVTLLGISTFFFGLLAFPANPPDGINYQGVLRDAAGNPDIEYDAGEILGGADRQAHHIAAQEQPVRGAADQAQQSPAGEEGLLLVFRLAFDTPLTGGTVGVRWKVRAGDAHPIEGSFSFTVTAAVVWGLKTTTVPAARPSRPSTPWRSPPRPPARPPAPRRSAPHPAQPAAASAASSPPASVSSPPSSLPSPWPPPALPGSAAACSWTGAR